MTLPPRTIQIPRPRKINPRISATQILTAPIPKILIPAAEISKPKPTTAKTMPMILITISLKLIQSPPCLCLVRRDGESNPKGRGSSVFKTGSVANLIASPSRLIQPTLLLPLQPSLLLFSRVLVRLSLAILLPFLHES